MSALHLCIFTGSGDIQQEFEVQNCGAVVAILLHYGDLFMLVAVL